MITLQIQIEEKSGTVSTSASASDSTATELEKNQLAKISDSFAKKKNPIHLLAVELVEKHGNKQ